MNKTVEYAIHRGESLETADVSHVTKQEAIRIANAPTPMFCWLNGLLDGGAVTRAY